MTHKHSHKQQLLTKATSGGQSLETDQLQDRALVESAVQQKRMAQENSHCLGFRVV